jgi:hypothetical protein
MKFSLNNSTPQPDRLTNTSISRALRPEQENLMAAIWSAIDLPRTRDARSCSTCRIQKPDFSEKVGFLGEASSHGGSANS